MLQIVSLGARMLCMLLPITLWASCSNSTNESTVLSPEGFQEAMSTEKKYQLLDVRTPGEYGIGHIQGALNLNVNATDFEDKASELDLSIPVYIYCQAGSRSSTAFKHLENLGFHKVVELEGGLNAWKQVGFALEK